MPIALSRNGLIINRRGENEMKKEQGFSLVELLIVVAIIAIIAAIAVPSLLTSRQAANEAGAIQGCRTLGSAEIAYASTNNQNYTDISTLVANSFLDSRFTAKVNGYSYASTTVPGAPAGQTAPQGFGFVGNPDTGLGRFSYGIAPDQVVRWVSAVSPATFPSGVAAGDPIGKTN
jgi:prepilin-type N-terminal cleavage/methylation domain-containing protein